MAWDVGSPVAVTGEDWKGAWRLANGAVSREGDINQALDGGPLRVFGVFRRTTTGITAVAVGLETQDADRSATATTTLALTLGAANAWVVFDGYITPPADQAYGRPYIAVTGSGGSCDFALIDIRRGEPPPDGSVTEDSLDDGAVTTPKIYAEAVTQAGQYQSTSLLTLADAPTAGVQLAAVTMTTHGGNVWLVFTVAWMITNSQALDLLVYVDGDYAGGSTPSGYSYKLPVETSSGADIRNGTTFSVLLPGLSAASHDFEIYARNGTGSAADVTTRTLVCMEFKK